MRQAIIQADGGTVGYCKVYRLDPTFADTVKIANEITKRPIAFASHIQT